jgi:hypothetical protein
VLELMVEIVVEVAFQNVFFCLEMHQNNIFKKLFLISSHQNDKKKTI